MENPDEDQPSSEAVSEEDPYGFDEPTRMSRVGDFARQYRIVIRIGLGLAVIAGIWGFNQYRENRAEEQVQADMSDVADDCAAALGIYQDPEGAALITSADDYQSWEVCVLDGWCSLDQADEEFDSAADPRQRCGGGGVRAVDQTRR